MSHRKIVLVIVEGPSDETALGVALSQLFDRDKVYIHIMHGDITSRKGVQSSNIISKLGNEIRKYANSQHYKAKDFKQIIHIVDTDAVFIPDEKIIEDESAKEILYQSDGIHTQKPDEIIERNLQKKENLYRLRKTGQIWNIQYRVYYMTCNLDHVLYNKRNSTEEEKEEDAYDFARKYKKDLKGFTDFMCCSDFSVHHDYQTSWAYIEEGMNSIERHTNLCIGIEEEVKN